MWDVCVHCGKEMYHDHAPQMAAALTYRTIFSLVPMVVLGLLLLRAFMPVDDIKKTLEAKAFEFTGLNNLALPPEEAPAKPRISYEPFAPPSQPFAPRSEPIGLTPAPATQPATQPSADPAAVRAAMRANQQMKTNLTTIMSGITDKVASVSLPSIGVVGFLLFIWAALAMAISVEQIFNQIYNAPQGRPWRTRIPIYWAIITLSPPLAVASITISSTAAIYVKSFAHTAGMGWSVAIISRLAALALSWGLLFCLYILMPNTRVDKRSALVGSFVTAIAWECLKVGFAFYVTRTVPFSALYGTLGLLPLFLLWIYLTWMVVLFGLELTYTLHATKTGRLKHILATDARDALFDPRRVITLMTLVARQFKLGKSIERSRLCALLHVPDATIAVITSNLEAQNLIYRVAPGNTQNTDGEHRYTLARPPENIRLAELIAIGQEITDRTHPPPNDANDPAELFIKQMVKTEQEAANDATLASLLVTRK